MASEGTRQESNSPVRRIQIASELDIVAARVEARNMAREMGFGIIDQARIATAISELARNVVLYAHSGEIVLSEVARDGQGTSALIKNAVARESLGPRSQASAESTRAESTRAESTRAESTRAESTRGESTRSESPPHEGADSEELGEGYLAGLEIICRDYGPGIANLEEVLHQAQVSAQTGVAGEYWASAGLAGTENTGPGSAGLGSGPGGRGTEWGMGLAGTRRLMDEFEIVSEVGVGTTVIVRRWLRQWPAAEGAWLESMGRTVVEEEYLAKPEGAEVQASEAQSTGPRLQGDGESATG